VNHLHSSLARKWHKRDHDDAVDTVEDRLSLNGPIKKRSIQQKKKARKEQRKLTGLVISGKARKCEGMADVALLEWLLSKTKNIEEYLLWTAYQL
jgi:hypothetical protein